LRQEAVPSTAVNSEGEEQPQMTPEGSTTNGDEDTQKESPVEYMIPKGLYVWGDVGTGKSMLMDLFFEVYIITAIVDVSTRSHAHSFFLLVKCSTVKNKRRVHFHQFMLEVKAHQCLSAHQKLFD
jgi:predicted ATPase